MMLVAILAIAMCAGIGALMWFWSDMDTAAKLISLTVACVLASLLGEFAARSLDRGKNGD
jgi:hypothetical protein